MFRIGIIGCGKIAQVRHIPEYAENPHAQLAGFYDLNTQRAAELAAQYGAKAYESAEAMLADPSIDAVSVCVANHAHAPITIAALKAGKHVLCEKPMATTLEECEEMVKTARETGKFLMIGHNQRLAKAHAVAKELIDQGMIGRIITFRTTFGHGGPETWSVDPGKNTWFFDKNKAAMGAMARRNRIFIGKMRTGCMIILYSWRLKNIFLRSRIGNGRRRFEIGKRAQWNITVNCWRKISVPRSSISFSLIDNGET